MFNIVSMESKTDTIYEDALQLDKPIQYQINKLDIDQLKNVPNNLTNLKSKVDKLDVDKLVPIPVDLSKLSDAIKSNVVNV